MSVTIHQGSILDCDVDVVVNPANGHLMHNGGLAKVIHEAATTIHPGLWGAFSPDIAAYWMHLDTAPEIPDGGAILGPAGALGHNGFRGIIHAVGPRWPMSLTDVGDARLKLNSAYINAMIIAKAAGFRSIALPAISAGIFGAPIDESAHSAAWATQMAQRARAQRYTYLDIVFALLTDEHVATFTHVLGRKGLLGRDVLIEQINAK